MMREETALSDTLRKKLQGLSSLIEVSHIINSTLDLPELLDRVMSMAKRVMSAEASSLLLINESGNLSYAVATGEFGARVMNRGSLRMGSGIAGWVASHDELLNIADAYEDSRFDASWDQETGFRTRSVLCVPLRERGRVIGVASVYNKLGGDGAVTCFDSDDAELFSTYCDQSAIAISNARLHKEAIERERLERDLTLATRIQESFLPQTFPSVPGYEFFATNKPSQYVGGDFYDLLEQGKERVILCVGDVSGKGVSAALYMARLISDLRILATETVGASLLAARLNAVLSQRGALGMFVTMFAGVMDLPSGQLRFANAGHPPALIRRSDGRLETVSRPSGPPLGVFDELDLGEGEVNLGPGDALIVYTDGITEAMKQNGDMFGVGRMEEILTCCDCSAEELAARMVSAVGEFARGGRKMDDLTLLVVRRIGT